MSSSQNKRPLLQLEKVEVFGETVEEERKRLNKELIDGIGSCLYTFLLPAGKKYFSDTEASNINLYKEKKKTLKTSARDDDLNVRYFSDTCPEGFNKDDKLLYGDK